MNEHISQSTNGSDIPAELEGAYSTWKQQGDPEKDSNRHTYIVDAEGKKRAISRAKFTEKYEQEQPAPSPAPAPVEEAPRVQYWSAGAITQSDPNRLAYTPTEEPYSSKLAAIDWQWGSPSYRPVSEKLPVLSVNTEAHRDVVGAEVKESRFGRARRVIGRLAASAALALAPSGASGQEGVGSTFDLHEAEPAAITIEAQPTIYPVDFELIPEPVSAPEAIEAPSPTATAAPTPEVVAESTPSSQATATELHDEVPQRGDDNNGGEEVADLTGPQQEAEGVPISEVSDQSSAQAADTEDEAAPVDVEIKPQVSAATELLTTEVTVNHGDGVTHVLRSVLESIGMSDVSPARLYEIYEGMITDPTVGPDGIFEGATLTFNEATGEYWIEGEAPFTASLTPAAAEWLQEYAQELLDTTTIVGQPPIESVSEFDTAP